MLRAHAAQKLNSQCGLAADIGYRTCAACVVARCVSHPYFWGQGFGSEVLRGLIKYGFEGPQLYRITAEVDPDNAGSLAMLGKLGFVETSRAKNTIDIGGTWFDSVYLELAAP